MASEISAPRSDRSAGSPEVNKRGSSAVVQPTRGRRRSYLSDSSSVCLRGRGTITRRRAKGIVVSTFTETMFANARWSVKGMITGEPDAPVRHTWAEVHERARRIAGGLAAAGVGHGDAVAVLAGAPVEIAPTAQGIWMRGASLTMLHQPTPRTDLAALGRGDHRRHQHDRRRRRSSSPTRSCPRRRCWPSWACGC